MWVASGNSCIKNFFMTHFCTLFYLLIVAIHKRIKEIIRCIWSTPNFKEVNRLRKFIIFMNYVKLYYRLYEREICEIFKHFCVFDTNKRRFFPQSRKLLTPKYSKIIFISFLSNEIYVFCVYYTICYIWFLCLQYI